MKLRLIGSAVVILAIAIALFFRGGQSAGSSFPGSVSTPAATSGGIQLGN